jgi:spore maturation protein CgeB
LEAARRLRDEGFDFGVVGRNWPSDVPVVGECARQQQQHHVWKRAKVALSINHFNQVELCYSVRQLVAMASGTPVVCHHVPGLEREFKQGVHCLWYRDGDEMVSQVRRLLADEALRRALGTAGREEVVAHHSWFARVLGIIPFVERIRWHLAVTSNILQGSSP